MNIDGNAAKVIAFEFHYAPGYSASVGDVDLRHSAPVQIDKIG